MTDTLGLFQPSNAVQTGDFDKQDLTGLSVHSDLTQHKYVIGDTTCLSIGFPCK